MINECLLILRHRNILILLILLLIAGILCLARDENGIFYPQVKKSIKNENKLSISNIDEKGNYTFNKLLNFKYIDILDNGNNNKLLDKGDKYSYETKVINYSDIREFSNLKFTYTNSSLESKGGQQSGNCKPKFEVYQILDSSEEKIAIANNSIDLVDPFIVDTRNQNIVEKGPRYYISRYLNNIVESGWVKKNVNNNYLYQKIVDIDISNTPVIEFIGSSNITQVNYRILAAGKEIIIEDQSLMTDKGDNSSDYRSNLFDLLGKFNLKNNDKLILKEIYVYIQKENKDDKFNVNQINFYNLDENIKNNILNISSIYESGRYNYYVDIKKLEKILKKDSSIFFKINFKNIKDNDLCNISLSNLLLFTPYKTPLLDKYKPSLNYFNNFNDNYLSLQKGFSKFFDVNAIIPISIFRDKINDVLIINSTDNKYSADINYNNINGKLNILLQNGKIKNINLIIPVNELIRNNPLMIVNFGTGDAFVNMYLHSNSERKYYFKVESGQVISTSMFSKDINLIEFDIPKTGFYESIDEIYDFFNKGYIILGSFKYIDLQVGFDGTKSPYYVELNPNYKNLDGKNILIKNNFISANISNYPLNFKTSLSDSLDWINNIKVKYHFNNSNLLEYCPIKYKINFKNGNSKINKICINNSDGTLDINFGNNYAISPSVIDSIDWSVSNLTSDGKFDSNVKLSLLFQGGILSHQNLNIYLDKFKAFQFNNNNYSPIKIDKLVSNINNNILNKNIINLSLILIYVLINFILISSFKIKKGIKISLSIFFKLTTTFIIFNEFSNLLNLQLVGDNYLQSYSVFIIFLFSFFSFCWLFSIFTKYFIIYIITLFISLFNILYLFLNSFIHIDFVYITLLFLIIPFFDNLALYIKSNNFNNFNYYFIIDILLTLFLLFLIIILPPSLVFIISSFFYVFLFLSLRDISKYLVRNIHLNYEYLIYLFIILFIIIGKIFSVSFIFYSFSIILFITFIYSFSKRLNFYLNN